MNKFFIALLVMVMSTPVFAEWVCGTVESINNKAMNLESDKNPNDLMVTINTEGGKRGLILGEKSTELQLAQTAFISNSKFCFGPRGGKDVPPNTYSYSISR